MTSCASGLFGRAMSLFARKSIHAAHHQQLTAFKAYAERAHKGVRGLFEADAPLSIDVVRD